MSKFTNPVIRGFKPDPTVCRVGDDYYVVVSSFEYFPGLPVYHSRNLLDWTCIGHVASRSTQLDLTAPGASSGFFAPTLRYHDGLFYLVCTLVNWGGNFLVTAKDPAGPWSDPIWIDGADGIDPSLYFDDDGKCWYVGNGAPTDPIYDGHRNIWLQQFNALEGKLVGPKTIIVDGGTDISKKPIWIEGPHIFKRNGRYYLLAAEGGTGEWHSVVIFRTDVGAPITGPYVSYEGNPIVTNRHLPDDRTYPITCVGHGDLVETADGETWMVLLACRPYSENWYNTGRETYLMPMKWHEDWPVSRDATGLLLESYEAPTITSRHPVVSHSEPFHFDDPLTSKQLHAEWIAIGRSGQAQGWLDVTESGVALRPTPDRLGEPGNPAFLGYRQRDNYFHASVAISVPSPSAGAKYGFAVQQNGMSVLAIMARPSLEGIELTVERTDRGGEREILARKIVNEPGLRLHIGSQGKEYGLGFSTDMSDCCYLAEGIDGTILSTRHNGGFVGAIMGPYAVGSSPSPAVFTDFRYASGERK